MKNTKNILLFTIITATLVLGTSVIPMQAYAGEDKNTKDSKSSINASSESDKKSASQHQDQDNFCYRGDDCQQANEGQQIAGKDNDAAGFNDRSDNLPALSTPVTGTGNGNGTGTGNGDGAGAICISPLVSASVTFEGQTVIICVSPSIVSTLPVQVGGQCSSQSNPATVVIGNETFRICIISLDELSEIT